jgi:chromosome segregation ATPase
LSLIDLTALEHRLNLIDHALAHITTRLEGLDAHMATLEEVTVALEAAVDRIGQILADVTNVATNAQAAADAAAAALAAAEAADMADDAAFAVQVADLTAALQAAQAALQAQSDANTAAASLVQSQVDELNALQ